MVTVLYLIRHGETEGAEKRRYKGSIDVPLSGNGIQQMERLSAYLAKEVAGSSNTHSAPLRKREQRGLLQAVYSSDLNRAVKSAECIARPHSLYPIVVPALRERNFGIWEGMSFDEIQEQYPGEFTAWAGNPLAFSPMGGESTVEVKDRAMNALNTILKNHKGEHIAVVSHGGVIRIVLCEVLGISLAHIFRIEQDYAACNIIEFGDGYPVVRLINGIIAE